MMTEKKKDPTQRTDEIDEQTETARQKLQELIGKRDSHGTTGNGTMPPKARHLQSQILELAGKAFRRSSRSSER